MLDKMEVRQDAMIAIETQLKEEMKQVASVKTQVAEKFTLLRDDRDTLLKKVDNIDFEIGQYRMDIMDYKKKLTNDFGNKFLDLKKSDLKI